MKFSVKKLFCAVTFGSLVLITVPAQAVRLSNLSKWPVVASVKNWLSGGIAIAQEQDFLLKQDQLVLGAVIKLKKDMPWSIILPHVAGAQGVFKAGKYKVTKIGQSRLGDADKVITFSPLDSAERMPFAVYFYDGIAQIYLTEKFISDFIC